MGKQVTSEDAKDGRETAIAETGAPSTVVVYVEVAKLTGKDEDEFLLKHALDQAEKRAREGKGGKGEKWDKGKGGKNEKGGKGKKGGKNGKAEKNEKPRAKPTGTLTVFED